MQRRKVLLPEPELPIMAMTSPSLAETEMPFSTSSWPNRLCRSSTTSAGVAAPIVSPRYCRDLRPGGLCPFGLGFTPSDNQLWRDCLPRQVKKHGGRALEVGRWPRILIGAERAPEPVVEIPDSRLLLGAKRAAAEG